MINKTSEWRPEPCGTRIGDEVEIDGKKFLQVKCRKCSKEKDQTVYHYIALPVA